MFKEFSKKFWSPFISLVSLAGVVLVVSVAVFVIPNLIHRAPIVEEPIQHTRVIEQCTRINLLSCIACHDFPAYVIDVQPEIWEE